MNEWMNVVGVEMEGEKYFLEGQAQTKIFLFVPGLRESISHLPFLMIHKEINNNSTDIPQ